MPNDKIAFPAASSANADPIDAKNASDGANDSPLLVAVEFCVEFGVNENADADTPANNITVAYRSNPVLSTDSVNRTPSVIELMV